MSDLSTEETRALKPVVDTSSVEEVANDLIVVPNRDVDLVPNIGLIGGDDALLVVETGLGPVNGARVLKLARARAHGRRLYLTTTHFHPEHAFGAQAFAGEATWLVNRAQAQDLAVKGAGYLEMFSGLGEGIAVELADVELPEPDVVYDGSYDLDLGGRTVALRATGRAHSKGDQVITVPDAGVMFTGDLAEAGQFPIFPWYPPYDADVSGTGWLAVMRDLIAQRPRVVVPGHGAISGVELLEDLADTIELLRDETWRRRAAGVEEADAAATVEALAVAAQPTWRGQEWIAKAVACFWTQSAA